MARACAALAIALAVALPPGAGSAQAEAVPFDAAELVRQLERSLRGNTSAIKMSMTTTTPRWTRTLVFRTWDDRQGDRSFTRILSPPKDRGTGFLKIGTTLWTYLPRVERITRMPPSMLLQSWMGSDFTNDDVVRDSSLVDDYTAAVLGEVELDGVPCVSLRLTPREEAAVVWARVDAVVERSRPAPRAFTYYDEPQVGAFEIVRDLVFSEIRSVQGRPFPHHWVMTPHDKPGHQTVLHVDEVEFDVELEDDLFSRANLKRAEAAR